MKKKIILLIIISAFAVIVAFGCIFLLDKNDKNATVVEPTCLENGYTIYKKGKKTQIKDIVEAKGHQFGDWEVLREATDVDNAIKEHTCMVCGFKETQDFYEKSDIPRICFEGDISEISKTRQVNVSAEFLSDEIQYSGYAQLKYQGHSSLKYDKKNFTVKFYKDEDCKNKNEFTFDDWNPENKFILKANYTDVSRSRNLICADIWSEMVSTRKNVPERLTKTSNNGAVDGFPVSVYLNGEFIGLYTLTLHKDDNLFVMKDDKKDGIVIVNKGDSQQALFRQSINWNNSDDWEVEYCGTEDETWIKEKLNRFIDFVNHSSDEEFKNKISDYADVNSLIDYMIAMYSLGLNTSHAKDLLLFTYDEDVWVASLFDMENAFGLAENEGTFYEADNILPKYENNTWDSSTGSLLWDRLLNVFYKEITERYTYLRKNTLSESNIADVAKKRIESVPQQFNSSDFKLYSGQPLQDISHSEQIISYTNKRLELLDSIFSKEK